MRFLDIGGTIKVGNRAGDFDDFEVASSREIKSVSGGIEEGFFRGAKGNKLSNLAGREGSIVSRIVTVAGMLSVKGGRDGMFDDS